MRVLDETGKQVGILNKDEALQLAREKGVDLVEIAPQARPPVARIIDFKKFKYLESKKKQAEKRKQRHVVVKEVRLSPVIGQHDLDTRAVQAREFIDQGHTLKVSIPFRGRLITHKELGFEVLQRFFDAIKPIKVVREPKFEGKILVAQVIKDKNHKEETHAKS